METALDVLSRAASMVETNDKKAQDPLYKGVPLPPPAPPSIDGPSVLTPTPEHVDHLDSRSSFGKELPSKMSMHERVKKWLEVSKPPKYEKEHHKLHKQISSESAIHRNSSPSPDHYRNGEPQPYNLHNFLPSHSTMHSPPARPPPCYPHSRVELHSPHEGPLNLTMNSSGNGNNAGSHSPTQSRPSVITCTTLPDRRYETNSNGSSSPSRKESSTDICDPAIEEHFRRSLGKHYPEYLTKNPSVTPSPPPTLSQTLPVAPPRQSSPGVTMTSSPPAANKNVSITGSVDDHFARALGGSTWLALKSKNDQPEVPAPNSVDDHFAKALGDTWLRLKDKKEQPRGPGAHPFPLSHPIPHPLPHPIPRAHSLPHPVPQRPTSPSSQSHSGPLLST
ncbi:transcription cofactor vestigial-like protein 4 isoform X2 [Mercenaria mercenaria]|uniref:transcription cofactor vestigial-like protein 4 isoform X2 n=1 Tax=Mercenaria mercenaria TaxID=6596 RepID=UPI00234F1F1B|nr:transcription cofactor vestigial-like protein 4 isoform X2 [Mercenaria mercenaria]